MPPLRLLPLLALALLAACGTSTGPEGDGSLRDTPPSALRTVSRPTLTVRVLRVTSPNGGGGDAVLVADSGGARPWHALVDAGGDATAASYLQGAGIDTLDLLVLTHAHDDHYGGMGSVLDRAHVRRFVYNGQVRSLGSYQALLERVRTEADSMVAVATTWSVALPGGGNAVVLPPLPTWIATDTDDGEKLNEGSLAVRVERGAFSFLSTGDAEALANARFASTFSAPVRVDALKAGHHGSADATSQSWLSATGPEVVVVSANGTTHPHGSTLALLGAWTPDLFCTPDHGIVTLLADAGGAYAVRTAGDPRRSCSPGTSAY